MSRVALSVEHNSICRASISCVITAIINGSFTRFYIWYTFYLTLSCYRCISEHEPECPICAQEHSVIRDIRRSNELSADQHEVFLSEVQEDGFKAIAAGFGRGMMNMTRMADTAVE